MNDPIARRRPRVRAPELTAAGGWINAEPMTLAELRGRLVLLDFWTSGCVNCLHVLEELRPLEAKWAAELVVLGVHSPKFPHEADYAALVAATGRYGVTHPVLNDPELRTWDEYNIKAWPTLVLVDPAGYVVHVAAGEGHAGLDGALDRVIAEVVTEHRAKGTLTCGRGPVVAPDPAGSRLAGSGLRYPAKVLTTRTGTLLVADVGHHQVVEYEGTLERRRFGSGRRGEPFVEPAGMTLLPAELSEHLGYDVVLADRAAHRLYGLGLTDGTVIPVAGTGAQWRHGDPSAGAGIDLALSSPWDVQWWPALDAVVVAMAGNHTLSALDPVAGQLRRLAGITVEGLRDGPAEQAFFAQTAGLAVDGQRLWLVDAESSALRWMDTELTVRTAVGTGLFDFGHRDGDATQALLQHPLGLAVLPDHSVAIADTYNGAVRRYDPQTRQLSTLASGIAEPSDLVVDEGHLLVVASAAHELQALPMARPSSPK